MKGIDELALAWRTDLMFARFDGIVESRGDHLVVRTPGNPTYWWGNYLLFDQPPRAGQADDWIAAFDETIRLEQPQSSHLAFGIDTAEDFAVPEDFAAAGLTKVRSVALTLQPGMLDPALPPLAREFQVRALELPARIPQVVELEAAVNAADGDEAHAEPGYSEFRTRQMQRYAAMQDAGLGHWFGVFARTPRGEQLVSSCGLFRDKRGGGATARFQYVCTHPEWRERGLATALIHAVCRHGLEVMHDDTLVIVADPGDRAIRIYETLGFEREREVFLLERPPR
jgi:RimJ/RimL family protein N-acetyltransferase